MGDVSQQGGNSNKCGIYDKRTARENGRYVALSCHLANRNLSNQLMAVSGL
jgi:hypothetical protein